MTVLGVGTELRVALVILAVPPPPDVVAETGGAATASSSSSAGSTPTSPPPEGTYMFQFNQAVNQDNFTLATTLPEPNS